jgi:hypothetical protein
MIAHKGFDYIPKTNFHKYMLLVLAFVMFFMFPTRSLSQDINTDVLVFDSSPGGIIANNVLIENVVVQGTKIDNANTAKMNTIHTDKIYFK